MSPADVQAMLQQGIDAVKRGDKQLGRELLLQVVEADENNEQAWLWLSAAVDALDDKITALENALTINPANRHARESLRRWRGAQEAEPEAAPATAPGDDNPLAADAPVAYGPPSAAEPIEAIDDPYQCAFCGAAAPPEARRCPECRRGLMVRRALSTNISPALRSAAFAVLAQVALAGVEFLAVIALLYSGRNPIIVYVFENARLGAIFGNYLQWPTGWHPALAMVALARAALLVSLLLGLLNRLSLAYYASIGTLAVDVIWSLFRWLGGFLGPLLAIPNILVAIASLSLIFASDRDFAVNAERMTCTLDRGAKGGIELNRRGHLYRRQGMWALAVAHWRAAVAAMPNRPEFYKDLAVGYAQIGYYDRALRALDESRRGSPADPDLVPLQKLIEKMRAADPSPRG